MLHQAALPGTWSCLTLCLTVTLGAKPFSGILVMSWFVPGRQCLSRLLSWGWWCGDGTQDKNHRGTEFTETGAEKERRVVLALVPCSWTLEWRSLRSWRALREIRFVILAPKSWLDEQGDNQMFLRTDGFPRSTRKRFSQRRSGRNVRHKVPEAPGTELSR